MLLVLVEINAEPVCYQYRNSRDKYSASTEPILDQCQLPALARNYHLNSAKLILLILRQSRNFDNQDSVLRLL